MCCRCWCPDRTLAQARNYITDSMGGTYAEGVILDLQKMWEESDIRTPLICFLSMGSDPTNSIDALAKKLNTECRAISMGQGQEVHARRLLQQSMATVSTLTLLWSNVDIDSFSGRVGATPELPLGVELYGWITSNRHWNRECQWVLSSLDHYWSPSKVSHLTTSGEETMRSNIVLCNYYFRSG